MRYVLVVNALDCQYSLDMTEIAQMKTIRDLGTLLRAINLITGTTKALAFIKRNIRNFFNAHA